MLLISYGLGDVALTWSYFCPYCAQFASESTAVSWSYELSDPDLAVQSIVYILNNIHQEAGNMKSSNAHFSYTKT